MGIYKIKCFFINACKVFLSSSSNGDEITSSPDKNSICYFEKGKTYEIRVRGLNSNIVGPWSDIKTVTVNVTPAGN